MKNFHPYHIVDQSPWPLMTSFSILFMTSGIISWIYLKINYLLLISMIMLCLSAYQWWRDITREGTLQGMHSNKVLMGLQWGMILFIISEVFFFISFFWAFLHSSLSPNIEVGMVWPPQSILPFNPLQIPLLNTTILLSSGISITWAHHSLLHNNFTQTKSALSVTLLLGVYFTLLQAWEYIEAPFTIADSIYGTTFFVSTGFHGLHVIVGSTLLLVSLMRHNNLHFSKLHHFGFEASAWYWHFVDVVWLLLYSMIYWWGS